MMGDTQRQVRLLVARALMSTETLRTDERSDLLDGAALALEAVGCHSAAKEARDTAALLREAERAQMRFIQIL